MLARRLFPTNPFTEFQREIGPLLDPLTNLFDGTDVLGLRPFPAMNVWEDGASFFAETELPGVRMEDITVEVTGNELRVKGERSPIEGEDLTFHRRERGTGAFARLVKLPVDIDADKVEAVLKDGVLTIKLPKAPEAVARKIAVKAN